MAAWWQRRGSDWSHQAAWNVWNATVRAPTTSTLNQKEIIFWLNTFILQQKLKIKTTVAFSEDSPPLQRKKNEYLSFGNFPENRSHFWCIVLRSIRQSGGKFKWPFSHFQTWHFQKPKSEIAFIDHINLNKWGKWSLKSVFPPRTWIFFSSKSPLIPILKRRIVEILCDLKRS